MGTVVDSTLEHIGNILKLDCSEFNPKVIYEGLCMSVNALEILNDQKVK